MNITYHKDVPCSTAYKAKLPRVPINMFTPEIQQLWRKHDNSTYCSISSRGDYIRLHLNNGDRIDINTEDLKVIQ